jgi:FixJ family two-component response regulator
VTAQTLPHRSALHLVVIDDDEDIRRALQRFLRSYGHDVRVFDSAEAYLSQHTEADCAILDIELPGLSGLELEDRMTREGRAIPVVFITAHDELASRACSHTHTLLTKPLDEQDLLDAITRATDART